MSYFDVVKQYDAMRQSLGGGLAPRAVLEAPTVPFGGVAAPQPAAAAPTAGPRPPSTAAPAGPKGPAMPLTPLKLGSWGGRQFDQAVIPKMQQLAAAFPSLRLSSGYRDPAHNAAVGGVKNSWHTRGRAGDWSGSARDMAAGAAWARANGAREVLVHNAGSGQHLHVAF